MGHFVNSEIAHICVIWALLIICGWIVGKLAAAILQTICKAAVGGSLRLLGDDWQMSVKDARLALEMEVSCV